MRFYKISFLVPQSLKDEEVQSIISEVEKIIQDQNGILLEEREKEKVKLGYEIKGTNHAFLASIKFQMEKEKVVGIKKKLQEKENILRVLLERKIEKTEKRKREVRPKPTKEKTTEKKTKVELKEIEEKLEEILDES